jgi:hypothetical protein
MKAMTRAQSLETINDLYGLESSYVQMAIEELGPEALSDEAVQWIASRQLDEERRRSAFIKRVAAYQRVHPHLGWSDCEEHVRLGISSTHIV